MPYVTRREAVTRGGIRPNRTLSGGRWHPLGRSGEWVYLVREYIVPYYETIEEINLMKREAAAGSKGKGKYLITGIDPFAHTPLVEEYCGDSWWEDGKARIPCHLKVELVGSVIHLALIDTEARRSCHTIAAGLDEALRLLDSHLTAGGVPWRAWGPQRGKS